MTTPPEPTLKSLRRPEDVATTIVSAGSVRFGDGSYPVVAGPIAVEAEEQILETARIVAESGGSILRAGTHVAGSSPYEFRGLGDEALCLLEHAGHESGLPTMTEVLEPSRVPDVVDLVDVIVIGPDGMHNFVLLRAAGDARVPVVLHRGPAATVDEWLMAAEYILDGGNDQVILCERGSRGFDPRTSETVDISVIPVVQRLSHLPVIVDPAPAAGAPDLLGPLALAARSVGADGLVVPVHARPAHARAGNGNHLDAGGFAALMDILGIPTLRDEIDRIDRELLKLVARRLKGSVEIARIKAERRITLRSPDRESELLEEARADALALGIDPEHAAELMRLILEHSRTAQRRALADDGGRAAG